MRYSNKMNTMTVATLMLIGIHMDGVWTIISDRIDETVIILLIKNNMMYISRDNASLQHHHQNQAV